MKIAAGAAKGLEYLHDKANPPVIYRDLKSSNILLDEGYFPKLSDFGLAKLGPVGDKTHVSTRVMGTYGYCAPEYAMTGQLTLKSDVYSFGVVFLEIITGRKAIDNMRSAGEHNLVAWVRDFKCPFFFCKILDSHLEMDNAGTATFQGPKKVSENGRSSTTRALPDARALSGASGGGHVLARASCDEASNRRRCYRSDISGVTELRP